MGVNEPQVLVSFVKPHEAVPSRTVSRWLKQILEIAGIDTGPAIKDVRTLGGRGGQAKVDKCGQGEEGWLGKCGSPLGKKIIATIFVKFTQIIWQYCPKNSQSCADILYGWPLQIFWNQIKLGQSRPLRQMSLKCLFLISWNSAISYELQM